MYQTKYQRNVKNIKIAQNVSVNIEMKMKINISYMQIIPYTM